MILTFPLLDADALREARSWLERAEWEDGRRTAGTQAAEAKRNSTPSTPSSRTA